VSETLALSRLHFPVRALGSGRRIGLWVQGCAIRCPGCISADTWRQGTGQVSVASVLERLGEWAGEADGLTVSGGEPLDQQDSLAELLRGWRALSRKSVLVFTGYDWPVARAFFDTHRELADAVIAGPYDAAAGQTLALRGSDNQTLHVLTPLGEAFRAYERERTSADRKLDAMFDEDGSIWFAGIPAPGDFELLASALNADGHHVAISADRAAA
jgi:anaerobic ribonucleoside-triphosphate reductase activating protein